jgi:CPA1 family monovalent cation:H+ antiporter
VVFGLLLGRVEADAFIELTLTTVLAYLSFFLAEDSLGVSGVMATLLAGLLLGGWGKAKISPTVQEEVEQHWGYLAAVANALIFLMVGLRVEVGSLLGILPMVGIAVAAMLLARALSVGILIPLQARIPGGEPVAPRYQAVMVWGGLRGGIALAIALSLPPEVPGRDTLFIPLAMGAVLFTLLVQGLTVRPLVQRLGLDEPSVTDRVARVEGMVAAKRRTLGQVPLLVEGGVFSPGIAQRVQDECGDELDRLRGELVELREGRQLDPEAERRLLYLRVFAEERSEYYRMFSLGHLSESAYRSLVQSLTAQTEAVRHDGEIPDYTLHPPSGERRETVLYRAVGAIPGLHNLAERLRGTRAVRDYEISWARSRASRHVLSRLEDQAGGGATLPQVLAEVQALYTYWHESAVARLDQFAEQFPEFVASAQTRLASRIVVHAERESIAEQARAGLVPEGVAHHLLRQMDDQLRRLRTLPRTRLSAAPSELLRKVPFFRDLPEEEARLVVDQLRRRTAPVGELIVRQGMPGSSMFLVARGVVRVTRSDGDLTRDLATLMSGDFFGEMALIEGGPRTADCRAVTPCALFELRKADLDAVLELCPTMRETLETVARERRAEQSVAWEGFSPETAGGPDADGAATPKDRGPL